MLRARGAILELRITPIPLFLSRMPRAADDQRARSVRRLGGVNDREVTTA